MAFHPKSQERLLSAAGFDPQALLASVIKKQAPWESIVDFATHESFCGQILYPRQLTLLKLMFLETENMTSFDLEVIEEWRNGFRRRRDVFGVQPDIWERIAYLKARGARRFPHIQAVLGRRASKGFIGGILGAEQIAYFYALDDWQRHFGVRPGKVGYLNVGATSLTQAKDHQFKDVRDVVESCKYLQPHIAESKDYMMSIRTPADLRLIAEMKAAKIPIEHPIATLEVQALSASSTAGRGATAFGIFLDEFAFMIHGTGSHKAGEEIYEDWMPSLDQFDLDGLTYIPSSPASKVGKCYSLYQEASVLMGSYKDDAETGEEAAAELKAIAAQGGNDTAEVVADPTKLVIQLPSWGLYESWEQSKTLIGVSFKRPIQPGPTHESQVRRKLRNPDKFKVEREGQWAEVQGAYFDPDMVERIFDPIDWRPKLEPQARGYLTQKYRIHCDPGRTGANFALCIGHLEESPADEHGSRWPHVVIDLLHVWRPQDFPPDAETGRPTIDYVQVQEEIDDLLYRFPSTSKISFDQWNSAGMIAALRRKYSPEIRVTEVTFTERENQSRFERVKSALNLGWVHCLAGETGVLTPNGVRPIRDLAGTTARLLTTSQNDGRGGGKWVEAPVRSFGVQPLLKVTLRRNGVDKVIHATAGHRWFVRQTNGTASHRQEVLTADLQPGQKLSYCYAQRHKATRPSPIGIAHGFTYGDGTCSRKGSVAQFCGDKDKALIPYFDLHPIVDIAPGVRRALDLPRFFKEKVDLAESPSYLYGWLAGYMAADGHVTKEGRVEIDSNDRASLEHVRAVCNLLGIHTTSIRTKNAYGQGYKPDGQGYATNLDVTALTEEFFLIDEHRQRWLDNQDKQRKDYRGYTVVAVEETDRVEEVFCAVVDGTHSFTLEDNILTGNCYRDNYFEDGASLLAMELKFLAEVNGRVERQKVGPVTTKDLCDAFCVVVSDLLHDSLERYGSGDTMATGLFGSTNVVGLRTGRDFERMASSGMISARAAQNRSRLASYRDERYRERYVPGRTRRRSS